MEGQDRQRRAYAPSYAPLRVQKAIWAGNKIRHKPYIWGGGHAAFAAAGYDCSGSVSYVLHAAGLLKTPFDSSDFMGWGKSGLGQWITVYTNPSHAFVEIAGIRLDTSAEGDPHPAKGSGPRWRPVMSSTSGFEAATPPATDPRQPVPIGQYGSVGSLPECRQCLSPGRLGDRAGDDAASRRGRLGRDRRRAPPAGRRLAGR